MTTIRIAAAQTLEYREDVDAALAAAIDFADRAQAAGARLLCFPEGFLQGYLTDAIGARRVAFDLSSLEFAAVAKRFAVTAPVLVIGLIESDHGQLFNTAVVIAGGVVAGRYRKRHLLAGEPAFAPGTTMPFFEIDGLRFGINICNDTNFPDAARGIADLDATLIVCPANNMMPRPTAETYRAVHNGVRAERCRETGLWLISADVTGERDGRVAWGPTAVLNPHGEVVAQLPLGQPGLLLFDLPLASEPRARWRDQRR
jgi:predicted amidohydrolase